MSSVSSEKAVSDALVDGLKNLDAVLAATQFDAQDEFIALESALPMATIELLLAALPTLAGQVHRNYIPGHKKGGSISRHALDEYAPVYRAFYTSPALLDVLRKICSDNVKLCPPDDPHAYALYYYTEAGDHVGFHYDTSYYKGVRFTVLVGLFDESSCRLEYELYRADADRESVHGAIAMTPGTIVIFNGDKVWHRVTPSAPGERRIALTLEYVTSLEMHPLRRFMSNMKDAIAYFGFRQVFARALRR